MRKESHDSGSGGGNRGGRSIDAPLTVPEVAAQLRVCERTVRRLLSRGELPCIRIGRSVRVNASGLAAYVRHGSMA